MLFGGRFQYIELFDRGDERLFGKHVEAVFEKVFGYGVMQKARRGVHNEIDIFSSQDIVIIGVNVAAEFDRCAFAAFYDRVDNRNDFEPFGIGLKVKPVDIPAASSLPQDGYVQLFHFRYPFLISAE